MALAWIVFFTTFIRSFNMIFTAAIKYNTFDYCQYMSKLNDEVNFRIRVYFINIKIFLRKNVQRYKCQVQLWCCTKDRDQGKIEEWSEDDLISTKECIRTKTRSNQKLTLSAQNGDKPKEFRWKLNLRLWWRGKKFWQTFWSWKWFVRDKMARKTREHSRPTLAKCSIRSTSKPKSRMLSKREAELAKHFWKNKWEKSREQFDRQFRWSWMEPAVEKRIFEFFLKVFVFQNKLSCFRWWFQSWRKERSWKLMQGWR